MRRVDTLLVPVRDFEPHAVTSVLQENLQAFFFEGLAVELMIENVLEMFCHRPHRFFGEAKLEPTVVDLVWKKLPCRRLSIRATSAKGGVSAGD
jgi:hypothetical protein